MRVLFVALATTLALLYFTLGLRLGYVTLTETYLLHAKGTNTYAFRTLEDNQFVGVTGSCRVRSGRATVRLYGPQGNQLAGQVCQSGGKSGENNEWSLNVLGGGETGKYRVVVDFDRYTGSINLKETRAGSQ
ncbi:hypothetical protein ACTQ9L_09100 [Deinococcus wulumuqiensis]